MPRPLARPLERTGHAAAVYNDGRMNDPTSKRRWFRYSLRTLFVVVTLFALWMGYHLNWIRQRRDARKWIEAHPVGGSIGYHAERRPDISWSLWILGEKAEQIVIMVGEADRDEREEYIDRVQNVITLFPESQVVDASGWVN
jgi:hypothetical protein